MRFENLLTRPDLIREISQTPGPNGLDPRGFEHLVIRPAGRVTTREKL